MLGRQSLPQHIFFVIRLELIHQTYSDDVVGINTSCFGKLTIVN